ncbi:cobyric acid synthase [Ornithinimicrobium sp. F0845]|uniref:cobyric acid synthase n=1 Tax=Ornithinimicrobium sp. F0845 TaxID=2926412 RepID=UPI001FF5A3A2
MGQRTGCRTSPAGSGALLVVGATSSAGKSTVVTALCRTLARRGVDVAPFKAQNMSNHAAVTSDGGEIGRAQAMQALAARVDTDVRMGPVLLKPSGERSSHVVVLGQEDGVADAVDYGERARRLRPVVLEALQSLRAEHEVVLLEGAGGAGEINLLERDLVNLPLAAAAGSPAVLVVDIERGGAFAAAYGTWALLPERLRACLRGFIINNFRGEVSLLGDGLRELEARTGVPVLGVLPHLGDHVMLGQEDSLGLDQHVFGQLRGRSGRVGRPVRVAVIRLPHLANPADLDPLVLEPSVDLRGAAVPDDLAKADLIIVPGSRATVLDLDWLRAQGLDEALRDRAAEPHGPWILGICAGYQMLGEVIADDLESGRGQVPGLDLLPVVTTFTAPKIVTRVHGRLAADPDVEAAGYEIRWGRPQPAAGATPWLDLDPTAARDPGLSLVDGCLSDDGRVIGTSVHGILDSDPLRQKLIGDVAVARGRDFDPLLFGYDIALEAHLEHLADWAEKHLDVPALLELARAATPVHQAPGW